MCITNIVSHNKPHVYSKGKANGRPLCSYNCYLFVLSLHVSLVSVMCFCSSRALKGSLGIGACACHRGLQILALFWKKFVVPHTNVDLLQSTFTPQTQDSENHTLFSCSYLLRPNPDKGVSPGCIVYSIPQCLWMLGLKYLKYYQ